MKTIKSYNQAVIFILGIFVGIGIFSTFAFVSDTDSTIANPPSQQISLQEAQSMTENYRSGATPMNDIFRAYAVNKDQLDAMNRLAGEDSKFIGFRLYTGVTSSGYPASIVVGIDQNGSDAINNSIYSTGLSSAGPCPLVCDSFSPL